MKPTFLIAGCGKCGTTTLAHLLGQHPDVFVSPLKEPNFLSDERVYARGWDWYASLFADGVHKTARGEASVSCSLEAYESIVCERIRQSLPELRIIYIARNPFKRLESVYREHHDSGHQYGWHLPYTLKQAVEYRPQMLINSLYWQRTAPFRAVLPESQILYLCLEDLKDNPNQVLSKCFVFIGVDPSIADTLSSIQLNEGGQKMYDTRLMRFIRTHKLVLKLYYRLPQSAQRIAQPLLREPFGNRAIYWEPAFRQDFIRQMTNDVRQFLLACGKPGNYWGEEFAEKTEK